MIEVHAMNIYLGLASATAKDDSSTFWKGSGIRTRIIMLLLRKIKYPI